MAGTLNIPLLSVFNDKGVKEAMSSLSGLSGTLKNLSKTALGAYSGFQLLSKSIGFIGSSANAARDLQRNMAGVETIFGANKAKMDEFIKTSETMGMSQADAAKAVTFLGSVFKQTGMPMDKVMAQTKTMVSLGADLASTYGYSVQEALTAMTATFRGEYDPIEKFGVAMKQQQVNATLAAMGLGKLKGQALIAAQQQVRYNMILERTTDAQGAFARQSNNLFEQQQILQAVWTDTQATLGNLLVPALTQLLGAVSPLIQAVGPHLAAGFTAVSDAIIAALPSVDEMTKGLTDFFDGVAAALRILGPLAAKVIPDLVSNLPALLGFFAIFKGAKFISGITIAAVKFAEIAKATKLAAKAAEAAAVATTAEAAGVTAVGAAAATAAPKVGGLMMLMNANVVTAIVAGLAAIAWGISNVMNQAYKAKDAISKMNAELTSANITSSPNQVLAQGLKNVKVPASLQKAAQDALAKAGMGATDETAKLLSKRKETTITPKPKTDYVDSAAAAKAAAKAAAAARKAAAEIAKIQKEVVAASKAMQTQITEAMQKAVTETTKAFDKIVGDAQSFIGSFNTTIGKFAEAFAASTDMGAFETDAVNVFKDITDQALAAKDAALIDDKTLATLQAAADKEGAIIRGIAKQRDILVEKIKIARNIVASVYAFGDITSAMQAVSKTVTETSTKIIDGVSVTLTKAVESAKASDLVAEYKKILDKTKEFATNLKALKAAGLDQNLFKQIVDAGVESGGATAAAIIAGGGNTISELNGLFADLQTAGSDIAATTTDVMYAAGQDITTGFIGGLISESENLRKQAAQLAEVFSTSFTNTLLAGINAAIAAAKAAMESAQARLNTVNPVTTDYSTYINGALEGLSGAALQKQLDMLSGKDVSAPGSFMNTLGYMSASAPIASTPVTLQVDGKTLATSLLTYERVNGAIYVRAQ